MEKNLIDPILPSPRPYRFAPPKPSLPPHSPAPVGPAPTARRRRSDTGAGPSGETAYGAALKNAGLFFSEFTQENIWLIYG